MEELLGMFWFIFVLVMVGIVPAAIGLLIYMCTATAAKQPGVVLQQKFQRLGIVRGRHLNEIVAVCGGPNATSVRADGVKVYQWIAPGYHITLLFDVNNICLGVSSEIRI